MSMPFIDPESLAQPEDYREGDLADDPPSRVTVDTDVAGVEAAPTLTTEGVEASGKLAMHLHDGDEAE